MKGFGMFPALSEAHFVAFAGEIGDSGWWWKIDQKLMVGKKASLRYCFDLNFNRIHIASFASIDMETLFFLLAPFPSSLLIGFSTFSSENSTCIFVNKRQFHSAPLSACIGEIFEAIFRSRTREALSPIYYYYNVQVCS